MLSVDASTPTATKVRKKKLYVVTASSTEEIQAFNRIKQKGPETNGFTILKAVDIYKPVTNNEMIYNIVTNVTRLL